MLWEHFSHVENYQQSFFSRGLNAEANIDFLRRCLFRVQNILDLKSLSVDKVTLQITQRKQGKIGVLDWSARFADMSPIKISWGMPERDVHKMQFVDVGELEEEIIYTWERLNMSELKKLGSGIPRRSIERLEWK